MPLGPGVRYRVKTNADGSKVRLAFRDNKVIEAKSLTTNDQADTIERRKRK